MYGWRNLGNLESMRSILARVLSEDGGGEVEAYRGLVIAGGEEVRTRTGKERVDGFLRSWRIIIAWWYLLLKRP